MDITGTIVEIFPTNQVSDRFRKREFVIEYATNPQYPEFIKLEFAQDRTDLLNGYQVGERVQVWFDLRGRRWTNAEGVTKYFNTVQAWRIQPEHGYQRQQQPAPAPQPQPGSYASDSTLTNEIPPPPAAPGVDEVPF